MVNTGDLREKCGTVMQERQVLKSKTELRVCTVRKIILRTTEISQIAGRIEVRSALELKKQT